MSLKKYVQKRNFKTTAEPEGKTEESKSDLIFVVQQHAASHMHYDFRLEFDGVLKSWAIPKGPSMNPEDKRLAVMVEDHPYSYKDFEGNIPQGNYGAGNVIVWDNGTYSSSKASNPEEVKQNINAGLLKGHLAINLNGKKLKGEFDLFKLKGKDDKTWLLVKKKDNYATDGDILKENESVLTQTTLEELNIKSPKERHVVKKKPTLEVNGLVEFVEPMLAERVDKPFDKKDWIFEVKYDGYRTIAVINENRVELFSRNKISFTTKFKTVAEELKQIEHSAVLDGEVVIEDDKGRSDFQFLQDYQKTGKGVLKYYVFDILNLDGNNTTSLSLLERKELLKLLIYKYQFENVFYSEHVEEKGISFYELAGIKNWEGIMAKDAASPYRIGKRSSEWLKIKRSQQDEAIIIGITEPKGARNYFGAILLASYDGNELKYIGNCGTGFNEETLKDLYSQFSSVFTDNSPIKEKIKLTGKVQWMNPKFVGQIKYTEVTQDGRLRHPVFMGLRIDKEIKDLIESGEVQVKSDKVEMQNDIKDENSNDLIKPNSMENLEKGSDLKVELIIDNITLHLTNQNKVYFPQDGITKGDIVNYYKQVAEVMLPYLKDRPQSMNRFPNGINGQSFYHKDLDTEKTPSWLRTEKIFSESNNKDIDYLVCNNKATLIYMANLGCIEINPWNSTIHHIENPDWMVIDLDPENDNFLEVVEAALAVKNVMDDLETECYCKTSGATGLHIYVPLNAMYEYDTVKLFAQLIAERVNLQLPETTTITRSVQKRNHKIYIDYLQNRHGQTLASAYSVRPKPGATVSTPLEWNEVNEKLSPSQFTIKNMLARIDKKGDLWKPVIGKGINIEKILKKLSIENNAQRNAI